jgi:hypothetical protein
MLLRRTRRGGVVSRAAGDTRSRAGVLGALREVIAAIDRRQPQVHRASESRVAREAASLRSEASDRVEEMERDGDRGPAASGRSSSPPDHLR